MANISAIKLPNGTTYTLKDNGALQLTGGQVTGPVTFGNSVSIDEATLGDLVVNGSASFTNNIQANTINGVAVGNSPKFTDTKGFFVILSSNDGDNWTSNKTAKEIYEAYNNEQTIMLFDSYYGWFFQLSGVEDLGNNSYTAKFIRYDLYRINNSNDYIGVDMNVIIIDTNNNITDISFEHDEETLATPAYVDSGHQFQTITLTLNWSSNEQTVTAYGVTSNNTVIVSPAPTYYEAYTEAGIYCLSQGNDTLTFKCDTVPSIALVVNVMVIPNNDSGGGPI